MNLYIILLRWILMMSLILLSACSVASKSKTHGLGLEFINLTTYEFQLKQNHLISGEWKNAPSPTLPPKSTYEIIAIKHYHLFSTTEIEYQILYGLSDDMFCGAHVERDKSIVGWSPAYFRNKMHEGLNCIFIDKNKGNLQIVIEP